MASFPTVSPSAAAKSASARRSAPGPATSCVSSFGQALRLAAAGMGLGVAGALILTRFLSSLLFGVGPTDPLTFGGVVFVVTGVVALACARPARRAMAVDPATVLRSE